MESSIRPSPAFDAPQLVRAQALRHPILNLINVVRTEHVTSLQREYDLPFGDPSPFRPFLQQRTSRTQRHTYSR